MSVMLRRLLVECKQCEACYLDNVALIADDTLTNEQVEAILVILLDKHREHP